MCLSTQGRRLASGLALAAAPQLVCTATSTCECLKALEYSSILVPLKSPGSTHHDARRLSLNRLEHKRPRRSRLPRRRATATRHRAPSTIHRATAEPHRATAESHRATAERHRATAESHRATAESHPATAESHRGTVSD